MTTPDDIARAIGKHGLPGSLAETATVATFESELFHDAAVRSFWTGLRHDLPFFLTEITIVLPPDETLTDQLPVERGQTIVVTLRKRTAADELRLFSLAAQQRSDEDASRLFSVSFVKIAGLPTGAGFETGSTHYSAWDDAPRPAFAPLPQLPDPRLLTRDLTGRASVPIDLRPWVRVSTPVLDSDVHRLWRQRAGTMLLAALSDEVYIDGGQTVYFFKGPPRRLLTLANGEAAIYGDLLQEATQWVFVSGLSNSDREVRHLLYAAEVARSAGGTMTAKQCSEALESAKLAYTAYVKSSSKETIKAVADLRKTVFDETLKATQKAQDLAAGLWKDLAVAAAPFVLKILPDSYKAANLKISAGLCFAAAAFLIFSYGVAVYLNHRYFLQQEGTRRLWRQSLNLVLTDAEIDDFAIRPIAKSVADYNIVRWLVGAVYLVLVLVLLRFGYMELKRAYLPPPPAATCASSCNP